MIRNEDKEVLTDKIKIMHLYLPKILNKYYNKEKLSELEKLMLVFNLTNKNELNDIIGENKIMEEYKKEALDASHSEEVIGLYDKELEDEFLKRATYQEGIEKGIEQGKNKKSIEIAKALLKNNVDINIILNSTGLSKEEIENL